MTSHFDAQRWAKLSLYEQMGNIGSEVSRAMNAIRRGDESALEGAYYRGLDLIDATVANSPSEARRREILRAREVFTTAVETNRPDKKLDTYFMQYALAVRAGK
jgi:hypothetical protein